jgi:cation diffusion facilitator CzcD-associated flavoprotein CzcO
MTKKASNQRRIVIIGAGPGGLCMAIRLKQAGFDDFVVLEKSDGIGGTWFHNRYPGCACDIPSHLYSYAFEVKSDWTRPYASSDEIRAYMEHCADKYEVRSHFEFKQEVRSAAWDDATSRWHLKTQQGRKLEADVVVSAIGMFNELSFPDIQGLESFAGTSFHSARWNRNHEIAGKTIGVIGSAASAIQLVPEIVKTAKRVHYFQRTPNWVMSKADVPYTEEEIERSRRDPAIAQATRDELFNQINAVGVPLFNQISAPMETACLENMAVVEDEQLRAKLVPDHPWGCKRPLLSSEYYPAFNRSNLELVTDGIERITPDGVVTVDGVVRKIDTLVLATGFQTTKYLSAIEVTGRNGLKIEDAWSDGAQAYKGVTTAGFPNLFMLYGPNTNADSLITMIEFEVEHAMLHIQRIVDEDLAWVDVKPEAEALYNEEIQEAIGTVVAWQSSCGAYYRSPSGRVVTQYPYRMADLRDALSTLEIDAFETARR